MSEITFALCKREGLLEDDVLVGLLIGMDPVKARAAGTVQAGVFEYGFKDVIQYALSGDSTGSFPIYVLPFCKC